MTAQVSTKLKDALKFARQGLLVFPTYWIEDGKCSCGCDYIQGYLLRKSLSEKEVTVVFSSP